MIRLWVGILIAFIGIVTVAIENRAQSPTQQIVMQHPSTSRPWVVSRKMVDKMRLVPLTEKNYIAFAVRGEDGNLYSLDDVLAGMLEIQEKQIR